MTVTVSLLITFAFAKLSFQQKIHNRQKWNSKQRHDQLTRATPSKQTRAFRILRFLLTRFASSLRRFLVVICECSKLSRSDTLWKSHFIVEKAENGDHCQDDQWYGF